MEQVTNRVIAIGLGLGLLIGLGFAVVIRFIPDWIFLETGPRAVFYAVQVVLGPVFVVLLSLVARPVREDGFVLLLGAVAGALLFDGLVIGFWPALYGQTGDALTATASTLLWAFAWIVIAGLIMNRQRARGR